jgi:hypothetical protein
MSTKKKKALAQDSNPVGYGRPPVQAVSAKDNPAILLENDGITKLSVSRRSSGRKSIVC